MTKTSSASSKEPTSPVELRAERLIGRRVLAGNNRSVGRLEEFRCEMRNGRCVVTDYVIGPGGLLERLGIGARLVFGGKRQGYLARWDQVDLRDPERPRLTCSATELRPI